MNQDTNILNQQTVSQNNENSNQNKTKTILMVALVLIVAVVIGIVLFGGGTSSTNEGTTVGYGETLEVNEIDGYYNFNVNVLSIEKNHSISSYFYNGDCFALKVNIKNKSTSNLSLLSLIQFTLINSSNQEIVTANMITNSMLDGSVEDEIASDKTVTGYLYFYNVGSDGDVSNIDDSDISKLKISVPKKLDNSGDVITGNYNDYYIDLK